MLEKIFKLKSETPTGMLRMVFTRLDYAWAWRFANHPRISTSKLDVEWVNGTPKWYVYYKLK